MPKKNNAKKADLKKLIATLHEFTNSLPSAVEKEQLQRSLSEIITFLAEIQKAVADAPSREQSTGVRDALRAVEGFVDRTKNNTGIAALLGIPQPRPSKPKPVAFTKEEAAVAQRVLSEMQMLPIDEMRSKLLDETAVPLRSLQALASQLGIRAVQRMGRDVLVHQVASKISNYRGYQGLRAGTESA